MSWIARTHMVARTARPYAPLSAGLGRPRIAMAQSLAVRSFHTSPQRHVAPSVQQRDATRSTSEGMEHQKKLGEGEEEQKLSPEEEEKAERRAKLQRIARTLVTIATYVLLLDPLPECKQKKNQKGQTELTDMPWSFQQDHRYPFPDSVHGDH